MRYGAPLLASAVVVALTLVPYGAARAAEKARITGLADANFGLIVGTIDRSIAQSLCVYSSSNTGAYAVTASGTGAGGSFALSTGSAQLPYDVLWADAANQTSGTVLSSGTPTGGFTSNATQHFCNSGPSSSATMTIVIRSAALANAQAGSYSGMLQITIAPE